MPVPKKGLLAIIGGLKPEGKGDDGEGEETGYRERLRLAMKDLRRALDDGDDDMMAMAFEDACAICDAMPHEEGEHEEGE